MKFFAKSKTFLVGEYSVLFSGSAILLATNPEFRLIAEKSHAGSIDIYRRTPAFSFYKKHIDFFHNFSINFIDPHERKGGFGASSAQFAMLYKLYLSLTKKEFNLREFISEYKSSAETSIPSGADCVAQYFNQHIYFDAAKMEAEPITWGLEDINASIFKTSIKIPTYSHIASLKKIDDSKLDEMRRYVLDTKTAILQKNRALLCDSIQNFYNTLCALGLVIGNTKTIVDKLLRNKNVLAAKGCGALAADTIVVIHRKTAAVRQLAESFGLKYISEVGDSPGNFA